MVTIEAILHFFVTSGGLTRRPTNNVFSRRPAAIFEALYQLPRPFFYSPLRAGTGLDLPVRS
jgi:hypothetical protein